MSYYEIYDAAHMPFHIYTLIFVCGFQGMTHNNATWNLDLDDSKSMTA